MYFIEKYVLIFHNVLTRSLTRWVVENDGDFCNFFFFVIDTAISFFIKQIPSAYLFLCQTFKKLLVMQHILIECPLYQLLLL